MYDVALLIERQLNELDADQIIALHEGLDDTVAYHLLLPVEGSNSILATSMTSLGGGQVVPIGEPEAIEDIEKEIMRAGEDELDASAALLRARKVEVTAELTEEDPIDALVTLVKDTGCDEVIILTEPHIVKEFLQVDWTSRAQRKLDVPSVHLLEHVPFDAQR
jgi:nucleotide-binding universal stress UspA family protein